MAKEQPTSPRPGDYLDELAATFQLDAARLRAALQSAVESGKVQLSTAGGATEPALRGLGFLSRLVQGQAPPLHPDGPVAFAAVGKAIVRRAELRPIPWEQAEARPPIEGLPEAALSWAHLKEQQGPRLGLAPVSIDELRLLATLVQQKRAYHAAARELLQAFEADLAVDENRTRRLLEQDVTPIRGALERDPELASASKAVRDYLFGAAQRGADTRADLAEKRKAWTAQAASTARVAGIDEGMRRMEEKVKAVLDDADAAAPTPAPPADDRRGPRR